MAKPKIATETEYPIEKGVPIPPMGWERRGAQNWLYPWDKMEPGDSIFFAGITSNDSPCVSVRKWSLLSGQQFTTRTITDENGVRGVRVWRVE